MSTSNAKPIRTPSRSPRSPRAAPRQPPTPRPNAADTPTPPARDVVAELAAKYAAYGWTIHAMKSRGVNDFIALKSPRVHFIQVRRDPTAGRYNGEQRGTFVQNAFSNDAVPVYADITARGVSLVDANTGNRIIIGRVGAPGDASSAALQS